MDAHRNDDSVGRELRGFELARRLIFHGVRTDTISKLTGLSHNRLTTLRRRLEVPDDERHRGPSPRSLDVFLRTARGRTEGAAVAALFPLFKDAAATRSPTYLDEGEQACDIYDAYLAYHPQSNMRFEELMLLKRSLSKGDLLELALCRICRALIMNNRYDCGRQTCSHCDGLRAPEPDAAILEGKRPARGEIPLLRLSARKQSNQRVVGNQHQRKTEREREHGPHGESGGPHKVEK